jgi:pyruvate-formate lyase
MKKIAIQTEKAETRFVNQLANSKVTGMVLSPLHFKKPTTDVAVSAEERELRRLHFQSVQLRKYRRLEEASEALTSLFPQIINFFMKRRKLSTTLTKKATKNLIKAIY